MCDSAIAGPTARRDNHNALARKCEYPPFHYPPLLDMPDFSRVSVALSWGVEPLPPPLKRSPLKPNKRDPADGLVLEEFVKGRMIRSLPGWGRPDLVAAAKSRHVAH